MFVSPETLTDAFVCDILSNEVVTVVREPEPGCEEFCCTAADDLNLVSSICGEIVPLELTTETVTDGLSAYCLIACL